MRASGPYDRALAHARAGQLFQALAVLDGWRPTGIAGQEQRLWGQATILRQLGRTDLALPLLERLVARRPDVARFRIALAEVLVDAGQTERARLHLDESLGGIASDVDQSRARKLLTALDTKKTFSGHFNLSFVPSTNAAQQTNSRTVTIGGRDFVIADSARKSPAIGLALDLGVQAVPQIGPRTRLRFGLSADARVFDDRARDDLTLRAEVALRYEPTPSLALEVGTTYTRRWLDGTGYSRAPGLFFGVSAYPDAQSRLQVVASLDELRHETATGLDGQRWLAAVSYTRAVTPQLQLRASLGAEHMGAAAPSSAYRAFWSGIGMSYYFRGGLRLGADASLRRASYNGVSPLFGKQRRDTQFRASIEASHSRFNLSGFAPVMGVDYTRRAANITVYSYDEFSARVGLTKRF
ncbi:porin family protein [Pseudooceanicola batsensis]|uniref:porin family protein n=1 Tax=Pseudooceanicola batsensis TaxID=314255 RepID=UPI00137611F5|nr:porin family protein [Pseudooceanicola batsensis]